MHRGNVHANLPLSALVVQEVLARKFPFLLLESGELRGVDQTEALGNFCRPDILMMNSLHTRNLSAKDLVRFLQG